MCKVIRQPKPEKLLEFVGTVHYPVIIWFESVYELSVAEERLNALGKKVGALTAASSIDERITSITKFVRGDIDTLLILKNVCTGYDLNTDKDTQFVFFTYDVDWSDPYYIQQSERINPFCKNPTTVYIYADEKVTRA